MARRPDGPAFVRLQATRETLAVVAVPSEPGRWFLTHRAVVMCPCPSCGAERGEPCRRPKVWRQFRDRSTWKPRRDCPTCRRAIPTHKATVCKARRKRWQAEGHAAPHVSQERVRCAGCGAAWVLDPGTSTCPSCGAPRTSAGHYAQGAA